MMSPQQEEDEQLQQQQLQQQQQHHQQQDEPSNVRSVHDLNNQLTRTAASSSSIC